MGGDYMGDARDWASPQRRETMVKDTMESMEVARKWWASMDMEARAAKVHDATDYAVLSIEQAYLDGKITDDARKAVLLVLGIACANVHENDRPF
jgi:hypothetical protein